MLRNIQQYIKSPDNYYLIGVYSINETIVYKLIEITLDQNELKILNKNAYFKFEDLGSDLKKDWPILLYFEGDNVISRAVSNTQGYRNKVVFKTNPEDFYFFEYHQNDQIFISIARKNLVDESIEKFNAENKFIVHIAIGPFILAQIFPLLEDTSNLYSFSHVLNIEGKSLKNIEKTDTKSANISLTGDTFSQDEIGLIAGFLNYKQGHDQIHFDDSFLLKNREEKLYQNRFKIMSWFTIIFMILVLFIGHQVLNYYINALAEKESEYSLSQQNVMRVNELKKEVMLKEKVLQASGVVDVNYLSQYFIDIGNQTPESITINSIEISPPEKKIKPQEKITIDISSIIIVGESINDGDFNVFVKNLHNISWVSKVDILDYSEDKKLNTFLIRLKK